MTYASTVLGYIDTNWDTNNYSPQPVRYNDDDNERLDTNVLTDGISLHEANVVTADSSPPKRNEPIGTEFDYQVEIGVGVRVEALHDEHGGNVTGSSDFGNLVDEVLRTIHTERKFPSNTPDSITHLQIDEENDNSFDTDDLLRYQYQFTVWFHGYEDLS